MPPILIRHFRVLVLPAAVLVFSATAAQAIPVIDQFGVSCDSTQLVPDGQGGSKCPGSLPSPGAVLLGAPIQEKLKTPRYRQLEGELDEERRRFMNSNAVVGSGASGGRLGMTTAPEAFSIVLDGGGSRTRTSGVGVSDTAGLLGPGALATSFTRDSGSGGLTGLYDASRFVGANQKLLFGGNFTYVGSRTGFAGGSSIDEDSYSFRGQALYGSGNTYIALTGAYQFGRASSFSAADRSRGSYSTDGYDVDGQIGHVFVLANAMQPAVTSRLPTKAPPRAAAGYLVGLDLSGHLGYAKGIAGGFIDSAGFAYGDERVESGTTGLRAKLFANVLRDGWVWVPYLTGTVDWRFSYTHEALFPVQAGLAAGNAVRFADARLVAGGQLGLDVRMPSGWMIGAKGFYTHTSDTEVFGGRGFVMIPFGGPSGPRY